MALLSVHVEILPLHILRVRIARGLLCQPRSSLAVGNLVGAVGHKGDAVVESVGPARLEFLESLLGIGGQRAAVESRVVGSRAEVEGQVETVFGRSVLQRLAACHRASASQVVAIEGGEALTAISPLGNANEEEAVGVNVGVEHGQAYQSFPGVLLRLLPPAVVVALVGNLRNEIDGGRVLKLAAEVVGQGKLLVLVARAVQEDVHRIARFGALGCFAFITKIEGHDGTRLEVFGQNPAIIVLVRQRREGGQTIFHQLSIGLLPSAPHHFLCAAHVCPINGGEVGQAGVHVQQVVIEILGQGLLVVCRVG